MKPISQSIKHHDDPMTVTQYALFSFQKANTTEIDAFIQSKLSVKDLATYESLKPIIVGVGKIRGVFSSEDKAAEKARDLIEHVDDKHSIFTCIVGQLFPLVEEGYANHVDQVDLQKEISLNMEEKALRDTKERQEIEQRRENLLKDVENPCDNDLDSLDYYIQSRVKFAQLRWSIEQHADLYKKCIKLAHQSLKPLQSMQERHPEFEETYMEKYISARREAHISEATDGQGFMKYMGIPLDPAQIPSMVE